MWGPTLNEVRVVDRLIYGLCWFMRKGQDHKVWNILDGQVENIPDLGIEAPVKPRVEPPSRQSSVTCWTCDRPHADDPNRRFCIPTAAPQQSAPPPPSRPAAPQSKGLGAKAKGSDKSGKKGKSAPDLFKDCARRTPIPSAEPSKTQRDEDARATAAASRTSARAS